MNLISEEYLQRLLNIANDDLDKNYILSDIDFHEVSKNVDYQADIYYLYMRDNMQIAFTVYVKLRFCPDLTKKLHDFEIERNRERIKREAYN